MSLTLMKPDRDICKICRSQVEKVGFEMVDDRGTRRFICELHVGELIRLTLAPLKTIHAEA